MIHYGIWHLHAHAYVHFVIAHAYIQPVALVLQPLRAAASGRGNNIGRVGMAFLPAFYIGNALHLAVFYQYFIRRCAAKEGEARILAERIVHIAKHHRAVFRAHVPYGAAHKVDVIPARFVCDFRHAGVVAAVHGVRRAEADVYAVRVVYKLLRTVLAYI